ncbi:MAG: hypothetical protein DHS20C01_35320 [marine bacterium B5-7]|nr:MAG: hypothetical protein DHS20C01_35320 [marine bacterium B5-7]
MSTKKESENNNSIDQQSSEGRDKLRRELLKGLGAGGALLAGSKALPDSWKTPVVDAVVLPAHAQTTGDILAGVFSQPVTALDTPSNLLETGSRLEYAYAGKPIEGNDEIKAFAAALIQKLGPQTALAGQPPTTPVTTTFNPTTTPTTPPPTTTQTTPPPTTTAIPGPDCPVGKCGELQFTDNNGSFILTVAGKSGSGKANSQNATIDGVSYAVTEVNNLAKPTSAKVTAMSGDCAPFTIIAVMTSGRCPG